MFPQKKKKENSQGMSFLSEPLFEGQEDRNALDSQAENFKRNLLKCNITNIWRDFWGIPAYTPHTFSISFTSFWWGSYVLLVTDKKHFYTNFNKDLMWPQDCVTPPERKELFWAMSWHFHFPTTLLGKRHICFPSKTSSWSQLSVAGRQHNKYHEAMG